MLGLWVKECWLAVLLFVVVPAGIYLWRRAPENDVEPDDRQY